jgi:putative ABC transport system permease protein
VILSQNIGLSYEILAAHKMRSLLSMLGIVVGVGAVVLMVAAGKGAEKQILDRIRDMGTNMVVVNAGQTRIVAGRQRQMATVTTLVTDDVAAIVANCPSVRLAAPAVTRKLAVRFGANNANTNVVGMTPDGFVIRNIEVIAGRFFDEEESRARRRVAILGPTVVRNLFGGGSDPIGQKIKIGRVLFEVIGVTQAKGTDANGVDQDDLLIVPLATAMRRLLNITYIDRIYAQAVNAKSLTKAETEMSTILRQRHRLGGKPDDFTIQNQATLLQAERETSQSMTLLVGGAAGISLLVGGVGILAVMLISVRERTGEIGLRRAVGALKRDIRNQFLIEAAILSGTGGIFGVVVGVAGALLLSRLGYGQTVISWPAAVLSALFSISLGILFGMYPALQAAALEPIEALQAE